MDPDVTKENVQKFVQQVKEILKHLQMEDPMTDIVNTLAKIEARLNYLCEARNFLARRDWRQHGADLQTFERELEKKRREQRNKD